MSLHQDPTQTAVRRQKRSLWTDAWRRMRRSHTAVIGMILFALIVICLLYTSDAADEL